MEISLIKRRFKRFFEITEYSDQKQRIETIVSKNMNKTTDKK